MPNSSENDNFLSDSINELSDLRSGNADNKEGAVPQSLKEKANDLAVGETVEKSFETRTDINEKGETILKVSIRETVTDSDGNVIEETQEEQEFNVEGKNKDKEDKPQNDKDGGEDKENLGRDNDRNKQEDKTDNQEKGMDGSSSRVVPQNLLGSLKDLVMGQTTIITVTMTDDIKTDEHGKANGEIKITIHEVVYDNKTNDIVKEETKKTVITVGKGNDEDKDKDKNKKEGNAEEDDKEKDSEKLGEELKGIVSKLGGVVSGSEQSQNNASLPSKGNVLKGNSM